MTRARGGFAACVVMACALVGCGGRLPGGAGSAVAKPVAPVAPVLSPPPAAGTPEISAANVACGFADLPAPRVWRLTHAQLRNTLRALFGFVTPAADVLPADARLEGYANGSDRLGVSPLLLDYYRKLADEVSTEAIRRSASLLPCPLAAFGQPACRGDFVRRFGARAFRRPLSAREEARFDEVYLAAARAGGPELGLKMVLEAMLLAPPFLFRFELGNDARPGALTELDDYEIASALAYTLWDAPPDAALLARAARGELGDDRIRASEAARLLADRKRAEPAVVSFVQQWLKIDHLPTLSKDAGRFPQYDAQMARDLMEENRLFVSDVVFGGGDRSLRTLFLASDSFVNSKIARIYGTPVRGGELRKTKLDPTERRGLLTQAAFLAARADADTTRPVDRGAFVREEILCSEVPPPPDEFKFDPSKITADMTAREKLSEHAKSAFCSRCHALFDGIGFALERYDAIGQFRLADKGKPIDPAGVLPLGKTTSIPFRDFVDLVTKLADRPEPYDCFAERALAYTTGRGPAEIPACEKKAIAGAFRDSGYRIDELILAIVRSPGFTTRRNPEAEPEGER